MKIIYEPNPSPDQIQVLYDGLARVAKLKKNQPPIETFGFFVKNNHQKILAGCNGAMYYGCLYIDSLWVDESMRGKNIGTQLLQAAENLGIEKGSLFSTVNTMDWEALGFYQKLGYQFEYQRTGYLNQSTLYFLKKSLRQEEFTIQSLEPMDLDTLVTSFSAHNWHKPKSVFERYWQEQTQNERKIWVAFDNQDLAGYITLKWKSYYQPFLDNSIPEIMDLNVLPPFRGKGIGASLLATAENEARKQCNIVGIGVGLYKDYGQAQKLYINRGYIPDGHGITYNYKPIDPGNMIRLDDDLVLWFTKPLK